MHKENIGQTEFTFKLADSEELMNKIYQLRFQVYCKECKFFDEANYPDGLEKDEYDFHSMHFVAEDQSGVIGTARLILENPHGFPFLKHTKGKLTFNADSIDRTQIAEISRLAISKGYRRRRGDGLYYAQDSQNNEEEPSMKEMIRRIKPMAFGIYREIYQECKRRRITHWFALMERSLWLLLRMHNFVFQPIGEEIDYCGPVKPYMCDIEEMEKVIAIKSPQFSGYFLDGLEPEYWPELPEKKAFDLKNIRNISRFITGKRKPSKPESKTDKGK